MLDECMSVACMAHRNPPWIWPIGLAMVSALASNATSTRRAAWSTDSIWNPSVREPLGRRVVR
jgi:hypothetical protein